MAYTGRTPAAAPLTSGDIPDGSVTPNDLSTGAPSWDANGEVTTGDGLTVGRGAGNVSTNTAVGASALAANQADGTGNTAVGYLVLDANTSGDANTAMGQAALTSSTTASANTAIGYASLSETTTGGNNTALGSQASQFNTTGQYNSALGMYALASNTTASRNTAVGYQALYSQSGSSPNDNVAVGYQAGYSSTTGVNNTFLGRTAGQYLTTGAQNVFVGLNAGASCTTGSSNTFVGRGAGAYVGTGNKNTILGRYDGNQGGLDIRTSSNNIVLSDGDGNPRAFCEQNGYWLLNNTSVINNSRLTVNNGVAITNGTYHRKLYQSSDQNFYFDNGTNQAYLSSAGSWTNASDARLKTNVRDIAYGLDTVISAQPRHFERVDVDGTYIGFVAQELQDVIPEVVSGDPETQLGVDYGALVAVAFKAIQQQQAMIEALEARIAALEATP